MCIAPITVYNKTGKGQFSRLETACHECWQCRENAINDWVGRNIAESKTAKWSRAITLTYGRNALNESLHERAVLLTYSDVQKYIKLLRRHRYPVRYFITGEYGGLKGRAHWHVMLYGQDEMPKHVLDENFLHARWDRETGEWGTLEDGSPAFFWPHGWSFWTNPTHAAVRYNCKYIQKDMGDEERQGHLAMSKKPPIGAAYFASLAQRYVAHGLSPQSLEYTFPEVVQRKRTGGHEMVKFRLRDRSAELFIEKFIAVWQGTHGNRNWPNSELIDGYYEWGRVVDEDRATQNRVAALPKAGREVAAARAAFSSAHVPTLTPKTGWKFRDILDWQVAWDKENPVEPQRQWVKQYEYERAEYERRQQFRESFPEYRDYV